MRALEKEGWLKVLHPHWSSAKVDTSGLAALIKTEQRMRELGYSVDAAPARMYFLTDKLNDREIAELQKLIPHKEFVAAWRNLENEAKDLAKRLTGKEAATPSRTWELLSHARPESILFLETTGRQQAVLQKIRNFFGKWREMKQKLPLPEMVEMRITPELPEYPKIAEDVFRLMLDGKLRSHNELVKFLKPFSPPPPPPPPPPPRRGRAARVEAAAAGAAKGGAPAAKGGTPVAKAGTAAAVAPAATAAAKGVKKKAGAPVGQPVLTPAAVQPQVAGQKAGRAVKPGAAKPAATTAPPPPAAATTKALAKAAAKAAASAHASKATGKKPTPAKKPTKPAAKAKKRH
jgi:hypothetical protein